jgi:nitrogen fixation/metabolism regulation signal transduction histidine kinase
MKSINEVESTKVKLSFSLHAYLRKREVEYKQAIVLFYWLIFALVCVIIIVHAPITYRTITYLYPVSTFMYYVVGEGLCVIMGLIIRRKYYQLMKEKAQREYFDKRLVSRIPLSAKELIMLGL